jgi:MFS family permease
VPFLWLVAALAATSILAVLAINSRSIDHDLARGSDRDRDGQPSGVRVIFESKPLLIFTASITLFHFANAAMLPLLGEKLAQGNKGVETLFMRHGSSRRKSSWCRWQYWSTQGGQLGTQADLSRRLRRIADTRAALYATQNPYALVSIQVLDGIGAGIFGTLFFIVIADLTRGTGRYNLAQGAASASWGLGAALSNSVAGFIVDKAGFSAAFVFLAGCALAAFLLLWIAMPETGDPKARPEAERDQSKAPAPAG